MTQRKIENLDEVLDSIEFKTKRKSSSKTPKQSQLLSQEGKKTKTEKEKINLAGSASNALRRSANDTLNRYIKSAPQYKVLKQQMEVIKTEMIEYRKSGNSNYYDSLKEQLSDLKSSIKKFEGIVKAETSDEINAKREAIKNSEKLKDLRSKLDYLKDEYARKNPNTLLSKLRDARKRLDVKNKYSYENEIEELTEENLDNVLDSSFEDESTYEDILNDIAELTDTTVEELMEMNNNEIYRLMVNSQTDKDKKYIEDIKMKIESLKFDSAAEIKRLKGKNDITDVIFNIFDFETEEEKPKEMLAAANVKYVQSIAYNICSNTNMLHNYDDAVAYGLLGLTQAINVWYNIQKLKDSAVSFESFAHKYISNNIKRGLYTLSSGGMYSGSVKATMEHKRSKEIEYWLKNNSELKDIPQEYIEDIVDGMGYGKLNAPSTESDYNALIGGENSDADLWSITVADKDKDSLVETKMNYADLVKSLKSLFMMFETKVDKTTGVKKVTDKKLFDKYDYQLFLMHFGMKTKYDKTTGKQRNYNQVEMAEELSKFYMANGIRKTFSQPAINARIKTIMTKIKNVMKLYPEIRKGFEYLLYNVSANQDNMAVIKANQDTYGISYDLKTELKDEKSTFAEAVNNGKTMASMYEVNQNTSDDEISDLFTMGGANVKIMKI